MKTLSLVSLVLSPVERHAADATSSPFSRRPEFCGGFNQTSATRTPFPLSGKGSILIDSHHPTSQVAVLVSLDANPTSIQQFTQLANGTSYGLLQPFESLSGEGEVCLFSLSLVVYPHEGSRTSLGADTSSYYDSVIAKKFCLSVDISSLHLGAVNGTPATIQYVQFTYPHLVTPFSDPLCFLESNTHTLLFPLASS